MPNFTLPLLKKKGGRGRQAVSGCHLEHSSHAQRCPGPFPPCPKRKTEAWEVLESFGRRKTEPGDGNCCRAWGRELDCLRWDAVWLASGDLAPVLIKAVS